MERTVFGNTGLEVSVLGLGGGGYSKLGLNQEKTQANVIQLIHRALDLGVNLFDTAECYGTEHVIGTALKDIKRDEVVICSKAGLWDCTPEKFGQLIDQSLTNLKTDYIDLYQFHGLSTENYAEAVERYLPIMEKARAAGKIRYIGLTEQFEHDTRHNLLNRAVNDPFWDSMMVGCNLINFSAARHLFPTTQEQGIGVLGMFAVRHALVNQTHLAAELSTLRNEGKLDICDNELANPLGFLLDECASLPEAAYRFCRHLSGIDVVLSGTGSVEHLEANVKAVAKPPLSKQSINRIDRLLGAVDSASGKSPDSPC